MGSSRSKRNLRTKLRDAFGDTCYWCGKIMDFPRYGEIDPYHKNMATIEHHLAKEKGDKKQILFLRLAHKGCNK